MGQDKALALFLGKPLIQHIVERLAPLADEIWLTTNHPDAYEFLKLPAVRDIFPGRGALGGLYTALSLAQYPLVAVIACDMPFVNASLLRAEVELLHTSGDDLVIPMLGKSPSGEERLEPFHAVYRRETCLPPLECALESGQWRVDSWFHNVRARRFGLDEILKHDPELLSFYNVNTPEELARAEQIARRLAQQGPLSGKP